MQERFRAAIRVDTDIELTELLVERGRSLVGQTFRDVDLFKRTGMIVIGAWLNGKFVVSPPLDTEIDENTILLVAGEYDSFDE